MIPVLKLAVIAAMIAALLGVSAFADDKESIRKARAEAKDWLWLLDSRKYGDCWDKASSLFKSKGTKDNWPGTKDAWEKAMTFGRAPLGAVKSRTVWASAAYRTVEGLPDGDYVVIVFDTRFERFRLSQDPPDEPLFDETLVLTQEADGAWRVARYVLRPRPRRSESGSLRDSER